MASKKISKKANKKTPKTASSSSKLVSLAVDIEVMTGDQLKKCVFGIEKKKTGGNNNWTIKFTFLTRDKKSDDFVERVKVTVKVELANAAGTVKTATAKTMTVNQKNFVSGVVTRVAEKVESGDLSKAKLGKVVEHAVSKR